MQSSICESSATELSNLIRSKRLSPIEVMEETLKQIEKVNPILNAFVSIQADQAMNEAKQVEAHIMSGNLVPLLAGIPMGVKDLEDVAGMVSSFGALPYQHHMALRDSVQVERLKNAGAIMVGKTNTPEFGFTFFTKNRLFGVTRNPWNTSRTPGGSSGGSAAAVASGMVPAATGSDAGGSIRIPASFSGCYGLKPSFGRIPMFSASGPFSLLPLHPITVAGPLTRTVEDAALYMDCVVGYHPADPWSLPKPEGTYVESLKAIPHGLRIAFSSDLGHVKVQKDVRDRVEKAVRVFEDMGHHVQPWTEKFPDVGEAWSKMIYCDFFLQLHDDLVRSPQDLGRSLVKTLDDMRPFSLEDQLRAQQVRTALNLTLWNLFDRFDLLLTPAMSIEAFDAKGPPPSEIDGHAVSLFQLVAFSYPFNLSGHPAASVPAGFTKNGLPVGLQIVGPRHRDDLVLQTSYAYQQMRPWPTWSPEHT